MLIQQINSKSPGDFPGSMGNNSEDSPNQRTKKELRIGAWKGIIILTTILLTSLVTPKSETEKFSSSSIFHQISGYRWHFQENGQNCRLREC